MAEAASVLSTQGLGTTERRDLWWVEPLLIAIVFTGFGVYATWAALQGTNFAWGPYLSPFYSPNLKEWFPGVFGTWPWSPAILILGAPLGFRATCYYYRKAYYRAYFMDPPACAVGEPRGGSYKGETAFPFILQNLHRYFFYLAALFVFVLWWDAFKAFDFGGRFGVGVGSLVMLANVVLLSLYTFSCHSFRHLLGGKLDCFSCSAGAKVQHKGWLKQTKLNEHHMLFAWVSLFGVALTDLYIRLVSMGAIQDVRLF